MFYLELIIALLALSTSAYEYTYSFPSWNGNDIANTLTSDDPKVVNKVRESYPKFLSRGTRDHDTYPIFTEQGVMILEDEPMGKFSISCIQLKRSVNKYRY